MEEESPNRLEIHFKLCQITVAYYKQTVNKKYISFQDSIDISLTLTLLGYLEDMCIQKTENKNVNIYIYAQKPNK